MSQFSFGSDPEFMLAKDGRYASAINVIKGSIAEPIERNNHRFYWDNVLAEAAVEPAMSKQEAVAKIGDCLRLYADIVAPYKLIAQSSQDFPSDELDCEDAKKINCTPDVCVYKMKQMVASDATVEAFAMGTLRTCGGHIHVGHDMLLEGTNPYYFIYLMDLFLGAPSVLMDKDPTSPRRRELYGQAGRFRQKPYGLEYRSVGNFWLTSPILVELVYDIVNFSLDFMESGKVADLIKFDESQPFHKMFTTVPFKKSALKNCIDNSDRGAAEKFLKYSEQYMPKALFKRMEEQIDSKTTYDLYKEWAI